MRTLIAILCIILLQGIDLPALGAREQVTILYTSSLNGNLDGCTCKSQPRAGLIKRAAYLRSLPPSDRRIILDAGDIFDSRRDEILAGAILETYRELGYDAVAVGDQDLSNGLETLIQYTDSFPFLSNNLAVCPDSNTCVLVSPSPQVITRGKVHIGLFSLIDPDVFAFYPAKLRDGLKITPPADAAETLVELLREKPVDLVVLLYHGPVAHAEELARKVSGIDVIIAGHEQRIVDAEMVSGTLIVSSGEEGNRLGILTLSISNGKVHVVSNKFRTFSYQNDPDDPIVRQRIDAYYNARKVPSGE